MNKRQKVRLVLCILTIAACVTFIISLSNRFSELQLHGFDLTEYWSLAVFGTVFAVIVSIYALVDAIRLAVNARAVANKNEGEKKPEQKQSNPPASAEQKPAEADEKPLPLPTTEAPPKEQPPLPVTADGVPPNTLPLPNESDRQAYSSVPPLPVGGEDVPPLPSAKNQTAIPPLPTAEPIQGAEPEAVSEQRTSGEEKSVPAPQPQKKKLTAAEKRKQKLLEDEPKKKGGKFGWVVLTVGFVFGVYFSVWANFPKELCYHNYTYNTTANGEITDSEPRTFRFYQDYGFSPYFVYVHQTKEFKVPLVSEVKGSDSIGEYVEYKFSLNEKYAKILDCALDRFTYIVVDTTVKHYKKDGRIVVSQTVKKNRLEESLEQSFENKVYTYKTMQD